MTNTIYNQLNYKDYLSLKLTGKGKKASFAQFIGCQQSFLSQILRGKPDLSIEHGLLANEFLEHTKDEARHFLLLLQYGRAASKRLRDYYREEIESSLAEQRKVIKKIDPKARSISEHAKGVYYSSWAFGAAHMLSGIDVQGQIDFLTKKVGVKRDDLANIIRFLLEQGLLTEIAGQYRPANKRIHLPATDPLVLSHHKNFRLRALEEMHTLKNDNLHYSTLMTVSKSDMLIIKDLVLRLVQQVDEVVMPAANESALQMNIDLFEI
jgi:uncharacterized protein (TIGR02147 family)